MTVFRKLRKGLTPPIVADLRRRLSKKHRIPKTLPDRHLYQPLFSPWLGLGGFDRVMRRLSPYSLVSADRMWVLRSLALQARHIQGNFWECGVYKGGTAMLLEGIVAETLGKRLRLFDTFEGMPRTDPRHDYHREGDFSDSNLQSVRSRVGEGEHLTYHPGFIPDTFTGFENEQIAFAHVDVDIHGSVRDCCRFIYPRLAPGGFMLFDDYGFPSCPGARVAVDEFFFDQPEVPLVLPTGQALVCKLPR